MAPGTPFKLKLNPLGPVSVPVSSHVLDDLGHVLGFVSICFWPQIVILGLELLIFLLFQPRVFHDSLLQH